MNAPAQTVFTHTLGKPRRRMDRHAPWKGRNRSAPRMAPAFCTPPAKRLFENMKGGARGSRPRPDEKGIKTEAVMVGFLSNRDAVFSTKT